MSHYNGTTCKNCQQELFFNYPALFGRKKYCSRKCLKEDKAKPIIKCKTCQIEFIRHQKSTTFCSPRCRMNCKDVPERICPHCGSTFKRGTGTNLNKYCETCAPTRDDRVRLTRYGVSRVEWDSMMEEQGGLCFLCKRGKATDMDHDHKTGKPRRPLCTYCNTRVGVIESDIDVMTLVTGYINSFR